MNLFKNDRKIAVRRHRRANPCNRRSKMTNYMQKVKYLRHELRTQHRRRYALIAARTAANWRGRRRSCRMEQRWPADRVERWPIDRLIPYARNARQHSDSQVAQLAASIKEWG